ncbi:leucyl aminopeptidase [Acuticoccus sediminis]|uniref:Leucyl aminopeptidase n=1 Tax=Acuticoccus sediminis TaxID=2184697 RepID=A0A8B2NW14_9HYPH|nr:M17 family peptidase N-terminal domain-containing protein [Acuticoccus sediminis]RAI01973.1 leucyl aminopeptidase [Acuticoccus sediminis]
MNIDLVTCSQSLGQTSLLVLGAYTDGTLTPSASILPEETLVRLSALVIAGELRRHVGAQLQLFGLSAAVHRKILLVCLGSHGPLSESAYRTVLAATARTLAESLSRDAVVSLTEVDVAGRGVEWRIGEAARLLADGAYRFVLPGRGATMPADGTERTGVECVALVVPRAVEAAHEAAARQGLAVAEGLALARDLGNMPSTVCTPTYLAETSRSIGSKFGLEVEVFEWGDLEKLGMGALLAVGHASARLIVVGYRSGPPASRPIVLVGEGLTFNSAAARPRDTRFEMSGAGAVLGTLWAAARLKLPLNLVGLVPAAECAAAPRPGCVVRAMSGETVEVRGTDAAGWLILCDALSYAEHFEPACVIDVATLTDPSTVAFGSQASCLFANDGPLAHELLTCGFETGDRAWQLPLWDDGEPPAGATSDSVAAAGALMRFAGQTRWAHLDIGGTATVHRHAAMQGNALAATGRPVPLLTTFLIHRAARTRNGEAARVASTFSGSAPPLPTRSP